MTPAEQRAVIEVVRAVLATDFEECEGRAPDEIRAMVTALVVLSGKGVFPLEVAREAFDRAWVKTEERAQRYTVVVPNVPVLIRGLARHLLNGTMGPLDLPVVFGGMMAMLTVLWKSAGITPEKAWVILVEAWAHRPGEDAPAAERSN